MKNIRCLIKQNKTGFEVLIWAFLPTFLLYIQHFLEYYYNLPPIDARPLTKCLKRKERTPYNGDSFKKSNQRLITKVKGLNQLNVMLIWCLLNHAHFSSFSPCPFPSLFVFDNFSSLLLRLYPFSSLFVFPHVLL